MPAVNLVNLERVSVSYGADPLLDRVSLGVGEGDRIGVVGRNGSGKTTLLRVLTGVATPRLGPGHRDARAADRLPAPGRRPRPRARRFGPTSSAGWPTTSGPPTPATREVVQVLLAGLDLDRQVAGPLRRRAPTDVAGPAAARRARPGRPRRADQPPRRRGRRLAGPPAARGCPAALVVVTHDRWFLDAVTTTTWELHDGAVDAYDGGYAAYVLARAERDRQAGAEEARRKNLARKELAWLRRGPPARTSKPKFRIEAANAIIEGEPPPRDRMSLERFAAARLGKDVIDVEHVTLTRGDKEVLRDVTWRLGPGDRVGLVGVNGVGKTSLLRLVSRLARRPTAGKVKIGRTVRARRS